MEGILHFPLSSLLSSYSHGSRVGARRRMLARGLWGHHMGSSSSMVVGRRSNVRNPLVVGKPRRRNPARALPNCLPWASPSLMQTDRCLPPPVVEVSNGLPKGHLYASCAVSRSGEVECLRLLQRRQVWL